MKLKSITFIENKGLPTEWELKELTLGSVNLIVGKNATGKSRTLNVINHLAAVISGQPLVPGFTFSYTAEFDGEQETKYELDVVNGMVVKEILTTDGIEKIKKTPEHGNTKIYFETIKQFLESQFTPNFLSASQRDKVQKPYLEPLFNWAFNTIHTRFGTTLGQNALFTFNPDVEVSFEYKNSEAVAMHLKNAEKEKLLTELKSKILADLLAIGYDIQDIGCEEAGIAPNNQKLYRIFANEKGIKSSVIQENMSQGMFRAISVIVHYNYMILKKIPCCLLIDDIGEGLDFNRASSLINILCQKAKESNYQLIMTSNDRFVMNQVPLSYWSVLVRNGQSCHSINNTNSPDVFKKFKYTGLNNFDFFSTDFYKGA